MDINVKQRFGIRFKLLAGFGTIGAIVLIIFYLGNRTIEATTQVLQNTVTSQLEVLSQSNQLLFQANQIRIMESELSQVKDFFAVLGILDQLNQNSESFETELNSFSTNPLLRHSEETSRLLLSWQA